MLCCVQATVLSWSVLIRERFDVEVLCVWFNMFCELVATTFRWRTVCEWRPSCCGNVKGQVCTVEAIHVGSECVGEHWCLLLYFRITLSRMLKTWWNLQRGARASARFRAEELKIDDVCTAKDKEKKQQRHDTRKKPVYQRQVCGISKSQVADNSVIFIRRSTPMYRVFNLCCVPATEIVCERTTPQPKTLYVYVECAYRLSSISDFTVVVNVLWFWLWISTAVVCISAWSCSVLSWRLQECLIEADVESTCQQAAWEYSLCWWWRLLWSSTTTWRHWLSRAGNAW